MRLDERIDEGQVARHPLGAIEQEADSWGLRIVVRHQPGFSILPQRHRGMVQAFPGKILRLARG